MAMFSKTAAVIACVLVLSMALAQSNSTATIGDEKLTGVCAETNPGDTKITLECPPGTILKKMKAASWGQNPGSCPAVRRHSKCTLDITDFMERYCLQSNKCPVTVKKEILGYPVDKQGQECVPDETPFTFVASFYCGIAGWNDVAPGSSGSNANSDNAAVTDAASDMGMAMGSNDTMSSTMSSESETKPQRSSSMAAAMSVAAAVFVASMLSVMV